MRKILLSAVMLSVILFLCSCSQVYDEKVITDKNEYSFIWELPERRADERSELFPESIEDKDVVDFSCRHSTYFPLGTGWQVELCVRYDRETFSAEVERIRNKCVDSTVCGESGFFDAPAYATVWNDKCCYEYALTDEEENTVWYVYLQLIDKDDLKINDSLIPDGYEMELTDSPAYSVYSRDAQ